MFSNFTQWICTRLVISRAPPEDIMNPTTLESGQQAYIDWLRFSKISIITGDNKKAFYRLYSQDKPRVNNDINYLRCENFQELKNIWKNHMRIFDEGQAEFGRYIAQGGFAYVPDNAIANYLNAISEKNNLAVLSITPNVEISFILKGAATVLYKKFIISQIKMSFNEKIICLKFKKPLVIKIMVDILKGKLDDDKRLENSKVELSQSNQLICKASYDSNNSKFIEEDSLKEKLKKDIDIHSMEIPDDQNSDYQAIIDNAVMLLSNGMTIEAICEKVSREISLYKAEYTVSTALQDVQVPNSLRKRETCTLS